MVKQYRIHPAIGIARLGNSRTEWFDGPQTPSINFVPPGGRYRDAAGNIRREAAMFRVYEYEYDLGDLSNPRAVRELTNADAEIRWHVKLANLKSFSDSPVTGETPEPNEPPTQTVAFGETADIDGRVFGAGVRLGTLQTDPQGRLRVLGGFGQSGSPGGAPLSDLFNAGWYDDVSDGPVRASIRLRATGDQPAVEAAWVIVGVPAYAHPIVNIVTMWDVVYDFAVRYHGQPVPANVSFTRDIYPMLQRAVLMQWTNAESRTGHGPGMPGNFLDPGQFNVLRDNDRTPGSPSRRARERVFRRLRNPGGGGGDMPRLNGGPAPDAPAAGGFSVTHTQYELFRRWSLGDFDADWAGPPADPVFTSLSPLEQTRALDMAGLWTGVGGSYQPGIEVGDDFARPGSYSSAYRVSPSLPAGFFTRRLSVPWQADFTQCGRGWWPGGRPISVTADGANFHAWSTFSMSNMVANWWKLGFIARRLLPGGVDAFLETEVVP